MKLNREKNDAHLYGAIYTMNIKGDYYFDEFVKHGGEETVPNNQNIHKTDFTSKMYLRLILDDAVGVIRETVY